MLFTKKKLIWKIYAIKKAFSITCLVKLIDKNKFVKAELKANFKVFIASISSLTAKIIIYYIKKALIVLILVEKLLS